MTTEGEEKHTRQIPNENFASSHLIEITHVNTMTREGLSIKNGRARMNKHPPIFLVKILDGFRFGV